MSQHCFDVTTLKLNLHYCSLIMMSRHCYDIASDVATLNVDVATLNVDVATLIVDVVTLNFSLLLSLADVATLVN